MDLFEAKNIKPMLIGIEREPFDHSDYLFEIKMDGERCVSYLGDGATELRSKRNNRLLTKFPELTHLHERVRGRCILDGELIVAVKGKPSFEDVCRRSIMTNKLRIDLAAAQFPATFVAYVILYRDGEDLTGWPLIKRKEVLQGVVRESERLAVSRYVEGKGIALYQAAQEQDLEGVVGKHYESSYQQGARSKLWVKIKYLKDDDFVIAGYIPHGNIVSLVLGQYLEDHLI